MNHNKILKNILGLFLFTISVLSISFLNVSAETIYCNDENKDFNSVYNPKIEANEDGTYNISLSPKSNTVSGLDKVEFYLYSVNGVVQTDFKKVSGKSPLKNLKLTPKTVYICTDERYNTSNCPSENLIKVFQVDVILSTVKCSYDDDACTNKSSENGHIDPKYCKGDLWLELSSEINDPGPAYEEVEETEAALEQPDFRYKQINCSSPNGDFETAFCRVKKAAEKEKTNYYIISDENGKLTSRYEDYKKVSYQSNKSKQSYAQFWCDYKTLYTPEQLDNNYYVNNNYLYVQETTKYNVGKYIYNFDPCHPVKVPVQCTKTCQEAVEVEYGPPVASKAGFCFEYKVRVTSRVSCYTSKIEKPVTKYKTCRPSPTCTGIGKTSGKRYYLNKGGPDEEYYACIEECDGGEFSTACSNKCYKEVYGSDSLSLKTNLLNVSYETDKLANSSTSCPDGRYYTWSGGSIRWHGGGAASYYGGGCPSGYTAGVRVAGICYHNYGGGRYCHDTCWWNKNSCVKYDKDKKNFDKATYLNKGYAEKDREHNIEVYKKAVELCDSKVSCSTQTGEFTISVDYSYDKNGQITKSTINYPKDLKDKNASDTAEVLSRGSSTYSCNDSKKYRAGTSIIIDDIHTKVGDKLWGCYNCDDSADNLYRVPWTFPGVWLNYKTGEISYYSMEGQAGWQRNKNKFCLPFDVKNTNSAWWDYYMKTIYGSTISQSSDSSSFSINDPDIVNGADKCIDLNAVSVPTVKHEDYNIHARAIKFGYSNTSSTSNNGQGHITGWNIEMNCFYATNDSYTSTSTSNKCVSSSGYAVRSVDLDNLFPDTTGADTSSDVAGRTPGYNWSKYATLSNAKSQSKNEAYFSNPAEYIKYIQEKGYGVYNDDYLDYRFVLSADDIRKLKSDINSTGNHYSFEGNITLDSEDGVSRYVSPVLHGSNNGSGICSNSGSSCPSDRALRCNNMVNAKSDSCQASDGSIIG